MPPTRLPEARGMAFKRKPEDADGVPIGAKVPADWYKERIGQEVAVSDWLEVTQTMIDTFADLTGDRYFLHVNPVRAQHSPFGGTIAHGFLTLSLLAELARQSLPGVEGDATNVNYGLDGLRFMSPVRSGARIRGRFAVKDVTDPKPGRRMTTLLATIEVEGEAKPALTAEWRSLSIQGR